MCFMVYLINSLTVCLMFRLSSDFFELNFSLYCLKGWGIYDFTDIYVPKKFNVLMILKG